MTLGWRNKHITHKLVSEVAWFISFETGLWFLRDFSVTNNDFEHAHYAFPQCKLP